MKTSTSLTPWKTPYPNAKEIKHQFLAARFFAANPISCGSGTDHHTMRWTLRCTALSFFRTQMGGTNSILNRWPIFCGVALCDSMFPPPKAGGQGFVLAIDERLIRTILRHPQAD